MNKAKLKDAERSFLLQYPGGFANPEMLKIAQKHKVEKMNKMAWESFAIDQFENPGEIVDAMAKVISQSSLVSIFEKPKFRDLVKTLSADEKALLSLGLREFLHGDQEPGFAMLCGLLNQYKLAKWPLLTVWPVYYRPGVEVFVKPTTAKGVIEYFELQGLHYSPFPNYDFYRAYREQINRMKKEIDPSLQNDNAAFCGFLMMSIR
jgi:hypothetical protein